MQFDRWLKAQRSSSTLTLINMADQPSSTAAKESKRKGKNVVKRLRGLFKRSNSVTGNDSASQSNLTRVSVSSAHGDHDPVSGNEVGTIELTVSSKYIDFILVSSTMTWPLPDDRDVLNQGMVLNSYLADLADLAYHPDPTDPVQVQSARLSSSSSPDPLNPTMDQGELQS